MNGRKDMTERLSKAVRTYLDPNNDQRVYWAREVTFGYGTGKQVRVDFMKFEPVNNSVSGIEKGDVYCYEVKSSVEDFRSPNGHNFLGDYNYYVMPEDVFEAVKTEIPYGVGVLVPSGDTLKSKKPARRRNREKPMAEVLLMMFRSAARDRKD